METPGDRVDSWKQIAAFIGKDVRTAMRWEKTRGLPVHRVPGGHRGAVFAYAKDIAEWLESADAGLDRAQESHGPSRTDELIGRLAEVPVTPVPSLEASGVVEPHRKVSDRNLVIAAGFLVLLLVAFVGLRWLAASPAPRLSSELQVTTDGLPKRGLVTDGKYLYFGEYKDGRTVLSSVSVKGGPVREITTPFIHVLPEDISLDGQMLLVLVWEGEEKERPLWIVPVGGGAPVRVGGVLCHSAAWSPDGRRITFASGTSIYLTGKEGVSPRQLNAFAETPRSLRWSLDGHRLMFRLTDSGIPEDEFWKLGLSDSDSHLVTSLIPMHVPGLTDCCTDISHVIDQRDSVFSVNTDPSSARIWLLAKSRLPWRSNYSLAELTAAGGSIISIDADRDAQKVFVIRSALARYEIERLDRRSQEVRPFLPGVDGLDVDFSSDGQTIAYVRMPERSLWISKTDGNSPHRISPPSITEIELPRWSPDAKSIAFIARAANRPWRIFLIDADGTNLREASTGSDSQGAPTWSPDGSQLFYANLRCEEQRNCAVHAIDRATGTETTIPGSEGLTTARLSPNGRFIAALRTDRHQVVLWSKATGQWNDLADGIKGNDLVWAQDSGSLYASRSAPDNPEIVRITLSDHTVERIANLSDFTRLAGTINSWFNLTPDGSILFLHIVAADEIYSADVTGR